MSEPKLFKGGNLLVVFLSFVAKISCLKYWLYDNSFCCTYSGSLFTNSNWFAFEDDRVTNDRSTGSLASPSPNAEGTGVINETGDDDVIVGEDDDLVDTATSSPEQETKLDGTQFHESINSRETESNEPDKPPEWVEWRETSDSGDPLDAPVPNGELQVESAEPAKSSESAATGSLVNVDEITAGHLAASKDESPGSVPPEPSQSVVETPSSESTTSEDTATTVVEEASHEAAASDKKDGEEEGN